MLKKFISLILSTLFVFCTVGCKKADTNDAGYSLSDADVWVMASSEKVLATQNKSVYADGATDRIVLSAAKNEYESGQIIVTATGGKELAFTVELSDLVNAKDGGKIISKDNFAVYTVIYSSVTRNYHANGAPTGMYPDALLPQENAVEYGLNTVGAGNNGAAWLEFFIPADTVAGDYAGTATVRVGKDTKNVPVSLRVYDVTLPDETTSKSLFTVNAGQMSKWELDGSEAMYDKYIDFLIKYRLMPSSVVYRGNNSDDGIAAWARKNLTYVRDKGLSTVALPMYTLKKDGYAYQVPDEESFVKCVKKLAEVSLTSGIDLVEKAVVYDWYIDEPFYVAYANGRVSAYIDIVYAAIQRAQAELKADPAFDTETGRKIVSSAGRIAHIITDYFDEEPRYHSTLDASGKVFSYADAVKSKNVVLCPKFNGYRSAQQRAPYDDGLEKWWYTCNEPGAPYASYHTDDSMTGHISIGWMMADYDVVGNLMWVVNKFDNDENPYGFADAGTGSNGDGRMLFPGKLYGVDGPVATLALDAARDGNEDYELIKILKNRYAESGESADAFAHMMGSLFYEESDVIGGYAEYETAREILLQACEAAFSPAEFQITDIEKNITDEKVTYKVIARAAAGAEVYFGDSKLDGEQNVYSVSKSLDEERNYLSFTVKKDGYEGGFSLDIGGKQQIFEAETLTDADFESESIESGEYNADDGYFVLTQNDAMKEIVFKHGSVPNIDKNTKSFGFHLYNYAQETYRLKVYTYYSGESGRFVSVNVELRPGDNYIECTGFNTLNWARRKKLNKLSFVICKEEQNGSGKIDETGVAGNFGIGRIIVYNV